MSDKLIYQALLSGITSAGITAPIHYPNMRGFTTPTNQLWLRFNQPVIGDNPVTLGAGGYNENQGSIQIDVFAPKASGILSSYDMAATIKSKLGSGASLTSGGLAVRIRRAAVSAGNSDDVWQHTLISIDFITHTVRGF